MLKDRNNVNTLYMKIKSEVENSISYLKKKREEDPYRSILDRSIFQASTGSELADIPTFEPWKNESNQSTFFLSSFSMYSLIYTYQNTL